MRNQPLLWDYFEMLQLFIVYDAENSFERQTTCLEKIHTMKRRGGLSRTEYACHLSECVLWEIDQVKNIDIAVVVELNKNFILHAEDVVSHDRFFSLYKNMSAISPPPFFCILLILQNCRLSRFSLFYFNSNLLHIVTSYHR